MRRAFRSNVALEYAEQAASRAGLQYSALPGAYPITVVPGDRVIVDQVSLDWTGPAKTLFICWGIKAGADFNNGQGLLGGPSYFAAASFTVPNAPGVWTGLILRTVNAPLVIPPGIVAGVIYDTFDWISYTGTALQVEMVLPESGANPDLDNGILLGATPLERIREFNVRYVKV